MTKKMYLLLFFLALTYSLCNNSQYFNATSSKCISCPTGCLNCLNSTFCNSCKVGFYPFNNSCILCTLPCSACSSHDLCTTCISSNFFNSTSLTCELCSNNCLTCNSSSYCTKCTYDHYILEDACIPCDEGCQCNGYLNFCDSYSLGSNTTIVVFTLIPLSIVSAVIITIYCLKRKCN